jgi:osmoprotectant transport system permease protein
MLLAAVAASLGFLGVAPNRLVSGRAVALWGAAPVLVTSLVMACIAALAALALTRPAAIRDRSAVALSLAAVLLVVAGAGQGAARLVAHAPPSARVTLGAGFWLLQFAFGLAAVDALRRLHAKAALRLAIAVAISAAVAGMAMAGWFDSLSLAHEWATHRTAFAEALQRHLVLVLATLALALAAGVPLGLVVQRRRWLRGPVFATLNVVQTIPSIALFGLLIAPLSAAGLSGIGLVPALIALVLYALLPVVRNTVSGLDGADAATLEAARGMGMAPRQILLHVALPLAAPALLAGLRIVTVQTIGLAVVAALIGAGGLGDFVFQGLGQYAIDLVLLGALPAIALAMGADFLLQLAAEPFRERLA